MRSKGHEGFNGYSNFRHFVMSFTEVPRARNAALSFKAGLIGSSNDLQHTTGATVPGSASA